MAKIDSFTNLYPVSKTLSLKAIPVGKTQENLNVRKILEDDEERSEAFSKAKDIITRYHREFAARVLSDIRLEHLEEYAGYFFIKDKDDGEKEYMLQMEAWMREQISNAFINDPEYKKLFGKELIRDVLPEWLTDEEEKSVIGMFSNFTSAFTGFNMTKENLYSKEEKHSTIAYRSINENLPLFLSNIVCYKKIRDALGVETIEKMDTELNAGEYPADRCFDTEYFNDCLTQRGIDWYNTLLGGMSKEDGTKVKGLNEYINLYNQQNDSDMRLPLLKPLYKQLLSEKDTFSFRDSKGFKDDTEVLKAINDVAGPDSDVFNALKITVHMFSAFDRFNMDGIYINTSKPAGKAMVASISHDLTGFYGAAEAGWNIDYDKKNMKKPPKDMEKYKEKRRKAFKAIPSISLGKLDALLKKAYENGDTETINGPSGWSLADSINVAGRTAITAYKNLSRLVESGMPERKTLSKDDEAITLIKTYLDAVKEVERLILPLTGTGREENRDEVFYGEFMPLTDTIRQIDRLYDNVRNYVTRKPYSKDKFKLYFGIPQFMSGWSKSKIPDYGATLAKKGKEYFLMVLDKGSRKVLENIPSSENGDDYEILDYMLLPGANKMLPKVFLSEKGLEEYGADNEIRRIAADKSFTKSSPKYSVEDCRKMIDYLKRCIKQHLWQDIYGFSFSDTESYADISGFYREVEAQGYKFSFTKADASIINKYVDDGRVYLFRLWTKDFSEYSKGKKNLFTLYFESLFNPEAGAKLCGGGELFLRKASIKSKDRVIHPKNKAVKNKNPLNPKKESLFTYVLIKDRRFTEDQYEFHFPVTLNRTADGNTWINDKVREALAADPSPHVIGLKRGERNLIYACVVDGSERIVEQMPLNEIKDNTADGVEIRTDYRALLARKEQERMQARKDWKTIEGIRDIKQGYLSQIIHKICLLIEKYDAVVAIEDLSSDFKDSRAKIEKSVYKKFEKELMDKLCYFVDKTRNEGDTGSAGKGWQLCRPVDALKDAGYQNGFVFQVSPYRTSNIDPVTGFVPAVYPRYTNMETARKYIMSFDSITYSPEKDMFCFKVNYDKFGITQTVGRKTWDIWTNADRLKVFRNPEKNSQWDCERVMLTDAFKEFFKESEIDYAAGDLREAICKINDKKSFERLFELIRLTLQMRNMDPNDTDRKNDYLISPVKDRNGLFFDSRNAGAGMPTDTGANGAYNIARKALLSIRKLKESGDDATKAKMGVKNSEWMDYIQGNA